MLKHICNDKCHQCDSRKDSILRNLNQNDLDRLSSAKGMNFYKKGQGIFLEGTLPTGLYCIKSGKVKVSKLGLEGKEQTVRLLKQGDVIGYRSLLSSERYQASAIALEDSEICFFQKNSINSMLQNDALLRNEVFNLMANDIKLAEQQIVNLAQRSVKQRICSSLLNLIEIYGYKKDQKTIDIQISKKQLSEIVGTAPETVSRLLSELSQEKIVQSKKYYFEIINIALLRRSAEF
jgi:CRP/FNR family transcriptional regulator, polysaccharide utilization system transcription regulator